MKTNGNELAEAPAVKDRRRFDESGKSKDLPEYSRTEWELEPLNKWVLIRKLFRGETTTEGGLTLVAETRSSRGAVLAVAEGVPLNVGDEVLFTNYALTLKDTEDLLQQKDLFLVRFEEIYARFRPKCT